jgi:predicted DNA-binding transcriptional regulator AlpA
MDASRSAAPALTPRLFLDRRAAAEALGVTPNTVDRWERQGFLPPRRQLGRRSGWPRKVIEAVLDQLPAVGPVRDRVAAALAARHKKVA